MGYKGEQLGSVPGTGAFEPVWGIDFGAIGFQSGFPNLGTGADLNLAKPWKARGRSLHHWDNFYEYGRFDWVNLSQFRIGKNLLSLCLSNCIHSPGMGEIYPRSGH